MPNRPSGTIIFLFTDIQGSTTHWENHREQMGEDLSRHDWLVRTIIPRNNGQAFKTVGDEFCSAFERPSDAVIAALEIQLEMSGTEWQVPAGIHVRVGIHTGETESRDDDYFGRTVNRVARLFSAGHGEQFLLTSITADLVGDSLPDHLGLKSLGYHKLKDLSHPQLVYQLVHPDLRDQFPPLVPVYSRPNNLPTQGTGFVGREEPLRNALETVRRPDLRLVTFTGPGGTGKTRLALQVIADLIDYYSDGAFFVPLSGLSDAESVVPAIAEAPQIQLTMSQDRELEVVVEEYLDGKQLLLVLDNYEHVLKSAGTVNRLLNHCPKVSILVTSREPVHISGEHVFPIPPLSLPSVSAEESISKLSQYEAVQLFVQRALAVRPDFHVTNENAPAVAQICVRLDGLPLAIELAASRLKIPSPQDLLARLDDRLLKIRSSYRDLPDRQQTLQNAIE